MAESMVSDHGFAGHGVTSKQIDRYFAMIMVIIGFIGKTKKNA